MQRTFDTAFRVPEEVGTREGPEEICFGALYGSYTLPKSIQLAKELLDHQPPGCEGFVTFEVRAKDGYHVLQLTDSSIDFAVLDTRSTSKLTAIEEVVSVRFEAAVEVEKLRKRKKGAKTKANPIEITVNIYGLWSVADDVGSKLSAVSAFLQHPKALLKGRAYRNPQVLELDESQIDMRCFVGITNDSPSARRARISDEVNTIFGSLEDDASQGMEWDFEIPEQLLVQLKPHQQQGVCFVLQRESHDGSSIEGLLSYGGIVADVMGLGKTLTLLTAILQSLPTGETFQRFQGTTDNLASSMLWTRATLVVVSSAHSISRHMLKTPRRFSSETFNTVIFHGQNRPQETQSLEAADIVLTTYGTIAAEQKGRKTLQKVHWFRVVLDEAHWIRNSSSKQYQAVAGLNARNRWCLTGTPIQNKLDDLASLASFLQLSPYPTKASFQKNILDPLYEGGPDFSKPLRTWLRAFCIRRTESLLQLPPSREEIVNPKFSDGEQQRYDDVLRQTRREMDNVVSQAKSIKKYNVLFTAILKLRMLCNTGTLPGATSTGKYLDSARQRDTGCERCTAATDEDSKLLLTAFQLCPDCERSLQIQSPRSEPNNRLSLGAYSPQPSLSPAPDTPSSFSEGHSEKLSCVTRNVLDSEPGSKHIVFSYWTLTLDALAQILQRVGVAHVQVDGRTGYSERSRNLKIFREDPEVTVLVMSIETGALGLNLTAANRVHLVEPQWNPSVEEQAVARALRMGQEREVVIFRYIMKGTVEQNIVSLQKKKRAQAKFLFDVDSAVELDGKLEDLKFVLDLSTGQGSQAV
ncbi:DNA repair protein rad5 [Colletotrichum musicola]|uniref:DNA repair protein rad5 n=1 Tax=Colletotrichum musicola TaxID=2175873 RepID=A0A8H6J433_9PEZI|nr:DNA repair protein rad5 [Colletotrichum musicola]